MNAFGQLMPMSLGNTLKYTIKCAEKSHLEKLPSIEQAAAKNFAEKDLPLEVRSEVTPDEVLYQAQQNGLLWVALDESCITVGFLLAEIKEISLPLNIFKFAPNHFLNI